MTAHVRQGLDDKHTIFGEVAEGMDVLDSIDRAIVGGDSRPLKNIRIRRTEVFEDPFDDPPGLESLMRGSPEPQFELGDRLEEDWKPSNDDRCSVALSCVEFAASDFSDQKFQVYVQPMTLDDAIKVR